MLAQAADKAANPAANDPNGNPFTGLLPMLVITGVLFYFIMVRPQKKREQAIRDKINNIKENERVVTIGGIHGVVTNVQRDIGRVTIRVDESTGAKLRLNITAIARVVSEEDEKAAASGGSK